MYADASQRIPFAYSHMRAHQSCSERFRQLPRARGLTHCFQAGKFARVRQQQLVSIYSLLPLCPAWTHFWERCRLTSASAFASRRASKMMSEKARHTRVEKASRPVSRSTSTSSAITSSSPILLFSKALTRSRLASSSFSRSIWPLSGKGMTLLPGLSVCFFTCSRPFFVSKLDTFLRPWPGGGPVLRFLLPLPSARGKMWAEKGGDH